MKKSLLISTLIVGSLLVSPEFVAAQGEPVQLDTRELSVKRRMMGGYEYYDDESGESEEGRRSLKIMFAVAHLMGIVTWIALMAFLVSGTRYYWHETHKRKAS